MNIASRMADAPAGHVEAVRAAIHENVTPDRWKRLVENMVEIATGGSRQAVNAAAFLANHCPIPDEVVADATRGARTKLASPEQVDEWCGLLAERFGVPLPALVQTLRVAKQIIEGGIVPTAEGRTNGAE